MSGVSVSTLVLFIASIVVAAGVAGTLVTTVGDISSSAETQGDEISESINTDIELLNDGGGSNFYTEVNGNAVITFYVRNSGSTTLIKEPGDVNVLINGRFLSNDELTITSQNGDDTSRAWVEGEVIEIEATLNDQLSGSGNRLTVSVKGTERSIEFKAEG